MKMLIWLAGMPCHGWKHPPVVRPTAEPLKEHSYLFGVPMTCVNDDCLGLKRVAISLSRLLFGCVSRRLGDPFTCELLAKYDDFNRILGPILRQPLKNPIWTVDL